MNRIVGNVNGVGSGSKGDVNNALSQKRRELVWFNSLSGYGATDGAPHGGRKM